MSPPGTGCSNSICGAGKTRVISLKCWVRTAIPRDRLARLVRYRGNWDAEWNSYGPDAKLIATEFVAGINAYIQSLGGKRPLEFEAAGYDPARWVPEDVVARVAGIGMGHNLTAEVQRAGHIRQFGLETVNRMMPPATRSSRSKSRRGSTLELIRREILDDYRAAIATPRFDNINEVGKQTTGWWTDP